MSKTTILLVEDDFSISEMLTEYLQSNGFTVVNAYDGEAGLALFAAANPALVILDLQLPKIVGTEVCRIIRKTSDVPIIMATGMNDDIDRIVGLEIGADDYLAKPFHPRELLARIRNLLKRCYAVSEAVTVLPAVQRLTLNADSHTVLLDGINIKLSPTEFKLIETIAANSIRVLSRKHIAKLVLGVVYDGCERAVDAHVAHIRKKLAAVDSQTEFIETIRGFGYKIVFEGIAKND